MYIMNTMSFIRKIKRGGKTYLAEVENKWVNGTCVQKHIRYVGKEVDGETKLSSSISDVEVDQIKLYGPLLVLNHLASEIKLSNILGEYGDEILSMVYAHCLDYKSLKQMDKWFARTDLNMMLDIECVTEKRLLNALDSIENCDLEDLQRRIFDSVKDKYKLRNSGVVYDVTNTYLYGKKCPFGKPGHDKDGVKGRPLVQIGLSVTRKEGIPMFHKVFDGNVHDSKTLQELITLFERYNSRGGILIYDRGIASARNIRDISLLKWDTLCGLPIKANLKNILRRLIRKNELIQLKNRVRLNNNIFYVLATPYKIDEVKGKLVLCYNDQRKRDIRESRYDEIMNAQALLQKNKRIKFGLSKYFYKNASINNTKIEESSEFDGYSCIFSTKPLSEDEMVRLYFDKDLVEKAFRSIKGIVRLQPVRHWLYNRVIAHVFICYLSYLLLSLLKHRLKKVSISPEKALEELDTMYKVYMKDSKKGFKISRVVTFTKAQETILRAISRKLLKT